MITENMDVTFEQHDEYAMIDQNTGNIVRGPLKDRNPLFEGLVLTERIRKPGHRAYFFGHDVEMQKCPMVCRRRPVHVYRGDWS